MAYIPPQVPNIGANVPVWCGFKFLYNSNGGGAAGTYTGSIIVPAYCYLVDVMLINVVLWTGSDTITAIVGDGDDDNGFLTTTNLKATDLIAYEAASVGAGTALAGGLVGAYIANSQWTPGSGTYGRYAPVARTLTCKITAAGTATAGETHFLVSYVGPFAGATCLQSPVYAAT